jgi:hypothetical protein
MFIGWENVSGYLHVTSKQIKFMLKEIMQTADCTIDTKLNTEGEGNLQKNPIFIVSTAWFRSESLIFDNTVCLRVPYDSHNNKK